MDIASFLPESIIPVNGYFLVELRGERQTKAGILLNNNFNAVQCQGTVISISDDIHELPHVPLSVRDIAPGAQVQFLPHNKLDVPKLADEAQNLTLVPWHAIVGVYGV